MQNIKNFEVFKPVLAILANLLNRDPLEEDVIKTLINSVKKLEMEYNFLRYIEISGTPCPEGSYTIRTTSEINDVLLARIGEAIQNLIEEIGRSTNFKIQRSFVEDFKTTLGTENISKIKKFDVNLSQIDMVLQQHPNLFSILQTLSQKFGLL